MRIEDAGVIERLDFSSSGGLVPVVVQHAHTGEVLMLGYANAEALAASLETGELWLYSRSRRRLWHKGESSGRTMRLVSLHADCDQDAVLVRVVPNGGACHTGERSCFAAPPTLRALADVLDDRAVEPPDRSYTARLLADRNLRLKKIAEEAAELTVACVEEDRAAVVAEAADLFYHLLVACRAADVDLEDVLGELDRRRGSPPSTEDQPT